ncbi:hypothetical protein ACOMHN_000225 [Nucella lapillus]
MKTKETVYNEQTFQHIVTAIPQSKPHIYSTSQQKTVQLVTGVCQELSDGDNQMPCPSVRTDESLLAHSSDYDSHCESADKSNPARSMQRHQSTV